MHEEWREIEGFPYYRVSNFGNVESWKNAGSWKRLKLGADSGGYLKVRLCRDVRVYTKRIHILVIEAFIRKKEKRWPQEECRHLDGNKKNNNVNNLWWGSRSENAIDKVKHGTSSAILTEEQVKKIRELGKTKLSQREIAAKFGISQTQVSHILRKKQWSHV